ncbi:hypothetical protein [Phycicoccus avicenniae]|uniref:hypothetical protein n=1 Tax=Phycicoccus avicenniae TaxID=2828860 RepID=UPI003D2C3497
MTASSPGGAATGAAPAPPRSGWRLLRPEAWPEHTGRRLFGAVLVALWVTFVVLAAANQLRLVTPDRFADDLAQSRVVTWRIITLAGSDDTRGWAATPQYGVPAALPNGDLDREQPPLGGREALAYFVDSSLSRMRVVDPDRGDPGLLVARLREAGVPAALSRPALDELTAPPSDVAALPALGLGGLFLAGILVGPAPRRGTRWFWFWQAWVTLGVGVLAYAVLELLRPAAVGSVTRQRGWVGFVAAVGASLVLAAALTGLADATHWLWVVRP